MDKRDLFLSCKTGDLSRIQYLIEEKDIDLNVRDKWGGTPLYYACLCGHYGVVFYLLQNGAQCDANTFDGERCLYGSLTDPIRQLLLDYKVISSEIKRRDKFNEFLRRALEAPDYSDIQFLIENHKVNAHRSILTSRSKHFMHLFNKSWMEKNLVDLNDLKISSRIFKILMQYLYLGQITVNKKDTKDFILLAKHFEMDSIVSKMEILLNSVQFSNNRDFHSEKKSPVISLQPKPLPQQDFVKLFYSTLPKEFQTQEEMEKPYFADLHVKVDSYIFFCHKLFICGRCSYLKAMVTDYFSEASKSEDGKIQVITLHDIDPQIFIRILQYIYTDTSELSSENVLDVLCFADLFILPGLKKLCASVIQENLTTDNVSSVIKLVRLYNLPSLEIQCTEFMAEHLEKIIDLPEFKNLVLEDASDIKNRQEVDTIAVIDDIRYHVDRSERVFDAINKYLLIENLLRGLKLQA